MKLSNFFSVFLLLLLITSIPTTAGWIAKGDYLELDRKIPGTNVITFDETGNYFYTFSGDSCLRRWDVKSGIVLDSTKIRFNGRFTTCTFSSDKKVFCLVYTRDDFLKDYVFFDAYSLTNFQKLDSTTVTVGDPGGDHGYYVYNYFTKLDYSYFNRFFIIGHGFSQSSTTMGITDYSYGGSLFSLSGRDNKSTTLAEGFINTFNIYQDQNRSVYVTSRGYSSQQYDYDYLTVYISDSSFTTSQKILDYSQKSGSSSTYYKVKNAILNQYDSCIYFTSENDNILRTYDYSKKIYLKDYKMPATTSYWINMSNDSRFLFLPYFNHLRILHPQTKTQIAEYTFDTDLISYSYNVDNNGLISLSKSNSIELRKPEVLIKANNFEISDTLRYIDEAISFYYNGPSDYVKFEWDFGDGTTSEERFPVHSYKNTGFKTIKLTVTNTKNEFIKIVKENYIRVLDSLKVDFIVQYQDPKDYHYVVFKNLSKGEIKDLTWDFGDGTPVEHSFNIGHLFVDGFHFVNLYVSDGYKVLRKQARLYVIDTSVVHISRNYELFQRIRELYDGGGKEEDFVLHFMKNSFKNNLYFAYTYKHPLYDKRSHLVIYDSNFVEKTSNTYYNGNPFFKMIDGRETCIDLQGSTFFLKTITLDSTIESHNCKNTFLSYVNNENNICGFNTTGKDKSLNRYNLQGQLIDSISVPANFTYLQFSESKEYLYYNWGFSFGKISKKNNSLDTFSIPIAKALAENRKNLIKILGFNNGLLFVLLNVENTSYILKLNEQNEVVKLFKFSWALFYAQQLIPINDNLFAVLGSSVIPGYMLIDSNLNIVYEKHFEYLNRNIYNLVTFSQNRLLLSNAEFNGSSITFNFILDTLPKNILESYFTSNNLPKDHPKIDNDLLIKVLPNPAFEDVEFILPESAISGTFEIYNQHAQRVFLQSDISGKLRLNTKIFPTGIYFCVYRTKEKVITRKFMVVH